MVDGKVYPPVQTQSGSITPPAAQNTMAGHPIDNRTQQVSRQRQSPTVTPPLRPIIPPSGAQPPPPPNTGYNNNQNIFPPSVPPAFVPGMRSYPNDSTRFPMAPHPSMGPPQAHVSSSTHPNNMGNGK